MGRMQRYIFVFWLAGDRGNPGAMCPFMLAQHCSIASAPKSTLIYLGRGSLFPGINTGMSASGWNVLQENQTCA